MADRSVVLKLSLKSIDAAPLKNLAAEAKKTGADINKSLSAKLNLRAGQLAAANAKSPPVSLSPAASPQVKTPSMLPAKPLAFSPLKAPKIVDDNSVKVHPLLAAARQRAREENRKDKVLGRQAPEVLPGNDKAKKALLAGKGEEGGLLGDLGLGKLTKALGPATVAFGAASAAAALVGGMVRKMGHEIMSLVQLANPGAIKRFNFAMQDTMAVIGHSATPLVEGWTKEIKILGDFLATILPSAQDFRNEIGDLDEVFKPMKEVLADLAPTIKAGLLVGLKALTESFKLVWQGIKKIVDVAKQLGLIKGGGKLNDSNRAAARQASFSDPEAFAKQFYQEIFSQKGVDPAKRTADEAEKIEMNTRGIWEAVKGLPSDIAAKITGSLGKVFDSLKGTFSGFTSLKLGDNLKLQLDALTAPLLNLPNLLGGTLKGFSLDLGASFDGLLAIPNAFKAIPDDLSKAAENMATRIKEAFASFPEQLARAIRDAIPIPRLPSLPGGGGGDNNSPSPLDMARGAIRHWILP